MIRKQLCIAGLMALLGAAFTVALGARPAHLQTATSLLQPAAEAPGSFVPVSELPTPEPLPAAPLLIAAYAFAWVALFVYLWSLWRRIGAVAKEMADVARRIEEARRR